MLTQNNRLELFAYSLLALGSFFLVIGFLSGSSGLAPKTPAIVYQAVTTPSPTIYDKHPITGYFDDIETKAKAVIIYDIDHNKIVFNKNASNTLPIASITKVMAMLTADALIPETTLVELTQADLEVDGSSGLKVGEKWKLGDLAAYTMVVSSNDGAAAIARTAENITNKNFVTEMNNQSKKLGLTATHFRNPTGLDINQLSGSYSTAYDIAKLFAYVWKYRPEIFSYTNERFIRISNLENFEHIGLNTNEAVEQIPNIVASKTGYTDIADGNLAVIIEPNPEYHLAIVVLGSTIDGRFTDIKALADRATRFFRENGL